MRLDMPKNETLTIQNQIFELGNKLGFIAAIEEQIHSRDTYAPVYDVVWYLNLTQHFDFKSLEPMFADNIEYFNKLKRFPFAGFEIEGSNTSSKNQLSNFANLYCGDFLYNFVIVNNKGALKEEDTYRRGLKLHRYFVDNSGDKNIFFLDKVQLNKSIEQLKTFDGSIEKFPAPTSKRNTFGGETISVEMYEKILQFIDSTGLMIEQNFSPITSKIKFAMAKECSIPDDYTAFHLKRKFYKEPYECEEKVATKVTDSFYIPKLDVVLGFYAPKGFTSWMKELSNSLKFDLLEYPLLYGLNKGIINELFIPLISIEIESSINKHLNGGIYNMAKNSYIGILVTSEPAQAHLDYFKHELGIKNVISYCLG
jgi:hypothetical protein